MVTEKEQKDFKQRLEYLKKAFPETPEVNYYGMREDKSNLNVEHNGDTVECSGYDEILTVGNKVINVTGNSVLMNLEIALLATNCSMECVGFIGNLI